MYKKLYNLLLETNVNDPRTSKCKNCGTVAKRTHTKKGVHHYQCTSDATKPFKWGQKPKGT